MADEADIFDHPIADRLDFEETINEVAEATALRLRSAARYIRETDTSQMAADVEAIVKKHPGAALFVAIVLGVIVGRSIHSRQ